MTGLPFGLTEEVLAAAMAETDPDGLAAATRLRRLAGPEQAAAALQQAALRRRAVAKFGQAAATMFFTRDGLEQATRPVVADRHAQRFVAAGVRRVVDLGCGIGADALAFVRAGLEVVAVERDPDTAAVAAANLAMLDKAEVICADAEQVAEDLLTPGVGAFCDPARRTSGGARGGSPPGSSTARGRVWRVTDFAPSWSLVTGLLDGTRTAGVKLGPALPHDLIPADAEAEWLTDSGDTVEVSVWAGSGAVPERRSALVRAGAIRSEPVEDPSTSSRRIDGSWHRLVTDPETPPLPVREVGRFLFEPVGAVLRSGGLAQLGHALGAGLLDPHLAYLTADAAVATPFATGYAVRATLPFDRRALRRWLVQQQVGRLEIKQRGTTVDPARLRRELRPRGPNAATLVVSRTPAGAVVLVVDRLE